MIQLIQVATKSESNEDRKEAERKIIELRELHPDEYFKQTSEAFSSKEVPHNIRESSGTLIAVSVLAKSKTGSYIWDTLNGNMKTNVKNASLEALIDPERNIRRAAANIVSSICFVELPRKEWEGIVEKICANINHENEIVKESSILTLGFICSRMKERTDFEFDSQAQTSILSGIILGLQQTQPLIIDTALKALRDSISSLATTLKIAQYRSFVLKQLVDIINSEKYAVEGLQILGQFVKTCYQFLKEYMEGLVQLLEPLIRNTKNEDACVAAMEIWENVAAEYKEISEENKNAVNYITGTNGQKIVASLLSNLSVMEDRDESDDNPISDSASKALETIFQNGSMEYKMLVLQFVKVSIAQNDWKHRQASIKGFSLLLYGLSDTENEVLISSSINQLMGLLNDSSKQVQFATMESLIIITEVCGKFVLTSPLFVEYLKLILSRLSLSQKFLKSGCRIVDNLCDAEKEYKLGKFESISDDLIGFFLKYALSADTSLAIVGWCTITIMNIIEVTHNTTVILKYLAFILDNFDNISQVKQAERREVITSAFFTFMQFCLHGLKKLQLEQSLIAAVYTKVTNSFKANSDVNPDGLYAIEALVSFFNGNQALVNDFWAYIVHALQKWQDPVLFRATISCIASFVTVYGDTLADKLQTFVPALIDLLESPNFGKELKLDCLVLLGEVFLSCGKAAETYLQRFLQVLLLCCTAAIQLTQSDFSYSESLKDNIIQVLMCIVHGLNSETSVNQQLAGSIPQLFQFAALSCNKQSRPTVSFMKKCVLLMADFAKFYPSVVKPLKQEAFINDCLNTLKSFSKGNEHSQVISYVRQQFK